jgi:hypothetical protein
MPKTCSNIDRIGPVDLPTSIKRQHHADRSMTSTARDLPPSSIAPLSPLAIHPIAGFGPVMP